MKARKISNQNQEVAKKAYEYAKQYCKQSSTTFNKIEEKDRQALHERIYDMRRIIQFGGRGIDPEIRLQYVDPETITIDKLIEIDSEECRRDLDGGAFCFQTAIEQIKKNEIGNCQEFAILALYHLLIKQLPKPLLILT